MSNQPEQTEELSIQVVTNESLSLITKAEIDVQISTAKAFPRSIKSFLDKAMSLATVNENVASSCSYALPRQGKTIDGPSVRLAEICCSTYGNIRSGARVIANDGKTVTAQGICHDLESNNCVTVEVKRRITDKHGKTFNEDMQVLTGNAACAIALRNAVFKVIPSALISEVYEAAKAVAKGTAETLVTRRQKAVEYFKQQGVKESQICDALGVSRIEDIDLEKMFTLRGMASMIKNGESTIFDLFQAKQTDIDKEAERIRLMIEDCTTLEELDKITIQLTLSPEQLDLVDFKKVQLGGK